jgi:predicted secreted hydrolase
VRSVRSLLFCCVTTLVALTAGADVQYARAVPNFTIVLPRDEGSHPEFRGEWWYLTGWLQDEAGKPFGFQVTFFRHRPGVDEDNPSEFAAKQLLFAHVSLSDPAHGKLRRAEKMARAGFGLAAASERELAVHIDDWSLHREGSRLATRIATDEFRLELTFDAGEPPLLHGRAGYSQKTPNPDAASYYYSLPQLRTQGRMVLGDRTHHVTGIAWLDHEWFTSVLDEAAQGWDWTGINLDDGSVIMALQMRSAQGSEYWAAATIRDAGGGVRTLEPSEVDWQVIRRWRSPRTGIEYPVEVRVRVGERRIRLRPLLEDQENDARGSTGTIYWEGAVLAFDTTNREIGKGYLELTGYGKRIDLGQR